MSTPITSYRYKRFDCQGEYILYSDRLETVASNICGDRHQANFPLTDLKPDPESSRHWNPWHRRGIFAGFLGVTIGFSHAEFPLAWQGLVMSFSLVFTVLGAACFFGNSRYEHWRMFRMTDGRILWVCIDRKDPEAGEHFVTQLNEAILASRKTPHDE